MCVYLFAPSRGQPLCFSLGRMYVIVFFVHDFFHTVGPIEMKLKTDH